MAAFLFSNPQAPERNPPIVPQFYAPSVFYISEIDNGLQTTIHTPGPNNYLIGNTVRFHIPSTYGIGQLDEQIGLIIKIANDTKFIVDIDSSQYDAFIASPAYGPTKPQVCAVGDLNSGAINQYGNVANQTYINGSFVNTSPIEGPWLD